MFLPKKKNLVEGFNDGEKVRCFACGQRILYKSSMHAHHFPKAACAGGTNTIPLCIDCHNVVHHTALGDLDEDLGEVTTFINSENRILNLLILRYWYLNSLVGDASNATPSTPT